MCEKLRNGSCGGCNGYRSGRGEAWGCAGGVVPSVGGVVGVQQGMGRDKERIEVGNQKKTQAFTLVQVSRSSAILSAY